MIAQAGIFPLVLIWVAMFASGEPLSGKLYQCVLELEDNVEKLVSELDRDLLKSKEENKDLRKELEQSEARNTELVNELEQNENQKELLNQELKKSEPQNKELSNVVLQQRSTLSSYEDQLNHLKSDLAQSKAHTEDLKRELDQVGPDATTLVHQHESRIETMTKEHGSLIREHNQALKERDLALVKLNTIGALLKEAQEDLESGKKVLETERISLVEKLNKAKELWDAEKIALTERLTKAKEVWDAERKGLAEMHTKEKEVRESERLPQAETHTKAKKVWDAEKVKLLERFTKVKEVWEAESKALAERLTKVEVWKADQIAEYPLTSRNSVSNIHLTSNKERGEEWQPNGTCKFQQLSQALVMDILSRLSVKSLFNCRCVCKAWHALISDSRFAHLHHSRSPIGILIHTYPPEGPSRELDFTQIDKCPSSDSSEYCLEKLKFSPDNSLPISKFRLWNSCNGVLCLSGPERDGCCYVCNPILGEFITIPYGGHCRGFVGLGFSIKTNQCKLLRMSHPVITPRFCNEDSSSSCDIYRRAEVYTMGTGVWRSIGIVPKCGSILKAPFDAILHGALHWVSFWGKSSKFIHSFDFEREEFQRIPPPSNFGLIEKQYTDSLKLGVLGDCLILSVFADDSSRFDMWVMKDYGIQESWTRSLVIENFFPMELSFVCYEPIILLSNGEILMFNDDDPRVIVCYNKEEKSFREARITLTTLPLIQLAYCPSFVSLHDVSKGEEVKRVTDLKTSCLG